MKVTGVVAVTGVREAATQTHTRKSGVPATTREGLAGIQATGNIEALMFPPGRNEAGRAAIRCLFHRWIAGRMEERSKRRTGEGNEEEQRITSR